MKRIALISLICMYALSIWGVGIKEFYCCGKLTSVSVALAVTDKDSCTNGDKREGCCKTKFQYFKIKDTHLISGEQGSLVTCFAELPSFLSISHHISFIPRKLGQINGIHAPPISGPVPLYLFNSVLRV